MKEKLMDLARQTGQLMAKLPLFREVVNLNNIDLKLRMTGWKISAPEYLGLWVFSFGGSLIIAAMSSKVYPFYFTPLSIIIGFTLPGAILNNRVYLKKMRFDRDFIVFAEKVLVGCSGGIDFYTILLRTANGMGFLSEEIKRLVEDIKTNSTGKEKALDRFAIRLQNPIVNNFVRIIKNNEVNGVEFSKELEAFIERLRSSRDSKIEGIARKMESKILVVVVVSVLPATFILVIVPFAIIVMQGLR